MSVRVSASHESPNAGDLDAYRRHLDRGCRVMLLGCASGVRKGFLRPLELGRFRGPSVCVAAGG
jgi:hypothetical protein